MSSRDSRAGVVAANLRRIIGDDSVNAWSQRHKLQQPTVRRIVVGEQSPTEQMIATLADACGLLPWQLMVPDLDPKNPPTLREVNGAERELYARLQASLEALKDRLR